MDDKLFKQKLTEVAEWQLPKLSVTDIKEAKQRHRGRGRPSNEDLYQEAHEEIFIELFNGINPTVPPELLKLKNSAVDCEDCGKLCENGRLKEIKRYVSNNKVNWREHCMTCQRWQDPYTGNFTLANSNVSVVWNSYLRDVKRRYSTDQEDQENQELVEDPIVIRSYPDTEEPL